MARELPDVPEHSTGRHGGHWEPLEESSTFDSACDVSQGPQASGRKCALSRKNLSEGFEGHNRMFSLWLHVLTGVVVFVVVIVNDPIYDQISGTLTAAKIQIGVWEEINEYFGFFVFGLFAFGVLSLNIVNYRCWTARRRDGFVAVAIFCLMCMHGQIGATSLSPLLEEPTPGNVFVAASILICALVVDQFFVRQFLSPCWSSSDDPDCRTEAGTTQEEEQWSFVELLGMLCEGTKAVVMFYMGLAWGAVVCAWRLVGSARRLPQWTGHQFERVRHAARARWESVREDDSYLHSVWMISALGVSGVAIGFFSLTIPLGWAEAVKGYERHRDCLGRHKGLYQDLLLFAGYGDREYYYGRIFEGGETNDTAVESFYHELAEGAATASVHQGNDCKWPRYLNELYSVVDTRLEDGAHSGRDSRDPIWAFKDSTTGKFVLYVDATIRASGVSVWVGFAVAALFGIKSLLSVLARYKFLTQMLVQVLPSRLPNGRQRLKWGSVERALASRDSLDVRHTRCATWEELNDEYSLSSASLFLGVWVSTAVFQLILIGGLATWVLASLIAWRRLWALVEGLVPLLVVYVLLLLFDWLVKISGPLLDRAVFEDHQLRRPVLWALYTLVRSALGLAVGLLFALWRLLLLMVMGFVNFNRLDKLVLPLQLDQGHKSLFSMAMMNAMLQKDAEGSVATNGANSNEGGDTDSANVGEAASSSVSGV
ncbi:unnamed protein product [Ostreobium quekettii]|uniref:Uncharacterized protein n=1 Tax=Ostreobium quekettii TaxID=121088 RepID=A0A8S1IYH3_9CHLO|nr:unnamed protein product [Ostreobium quekettii]|eukprot:evm.model.scf_294.9 EVM.evm.TU.scf_294.9   scf_294:66586-70226(+)